METLAVRLPKTENPQTFRLKIRPSFPLLAAKWGECRDMGGFCYIYAAKHVTEIWDWVCRDWNGFVDMGLEFGGLGYGIDI